MNKDELLLRPMRKEDLELVLEWRNLPEIRIHMLNDRVITKQEHEIWFVEKSKNQDHKLMIAIKNKVRFGFVQIKINREKKIGEWGFYRDPRFTGASGIDLAKLAINYAFCDLNLRELWGYVMKNNTRSIEFHTRNGFILLLNTGQPPNLMTFCLKQEWWMNAKNDN